MLMMFAWPIFARNSLTTLSKLSCPSSMQSVRRMVLTRILFSVSLAATSSGGGGFFFRSFARGAWSGGVEIFFSPPAGGGEGGGGHVSVRGVGGGSGDLV